MQFSNNDINFSILKERAFNLRWANMPAGVIPLTAADPDFPCAPQIADAICKFTKDRYFSYAPPEGYIFFREAMASFYWNKRKIEVSPDYILPVDSAAYGVYLTCKTILQKDDEAIVLDPVDFLFKYSVEELGAKAVSLPIPINPEAEIDYSLLQSLIGPRTKMICLCNPINPTGKVFKKEELAKIAEIAVKNNIIILSDEIWSDIVFSPSEYVSIASLNKEIAHQTITVTGFSKSYGLAGLRIGTVMTENDDLFKRLMMTSGHNSTIHGSNVMGQVAATSALNECGLWLQDFILHLQKMRDLSFDQIKTIPGFSCYLPEGCYLLFCNIEKTGLDSTKLQTLLLEKAKVAVVPGLPRWFGNKAEGHIRICFSTSEEILKEAFGRIRTTLKAEIG